MVLRTLEFFLFIGNTRNTLDVSEVLDMLNSVQSYTDGETEL